MAGCKDLYLSDICCLVFITWCSVRDPISCCARLVFECREDLLPVADIVTPNLKEAAALLGGVQLATVDDMRSAAKAIHDMGPRLVLGKCT